MPFDLAMLLQGIHSWEMKASPKGPCTRAFIAALIAEVHHGACVISPPTHTGNKANASYQRNGINDSTFPEAGVKLIFLVHRKSLP